MYDEAGGRIGVVKLHERTRTFLGNARPIASTGIWSTLTLGVACMHITGA